MSEPLKEFALEKFFAFYREDLEAEQLDDENVVISFPIHFSGFHRVEVTVTRTSSDRFVISDGAKTIEELKNSGYEVGTKLRRRIEQLSRAAEVRVVNGFLVTETDAGGLGASIQRFVEAAKTIGDAYLVQRTHSRRDTTLLDMVSAFLVEQSVTYQMRQNLRGRVENHTVDFYFPPNGVPGLALSVMGNPTRMAAEAWAFKSSDIKETNERTKVGVVFDAQSASDGSKAILKQTADVSVPSDEIAGLRGELRSLGLMQRT